MLFSVASPDRSALQAEWGGWYDLLPESAREQALEALERSEQRRRDGAVVYPPRPDVFRALRLTQPEALKCVILGQDPYHGPGQAQGLSFSVAASCKLPPSLRNIFRELSEDLHCPLPPNGDLSGWARQGVLLLNSILTVEDGSPASHAKLGWQAFTGALVQAILSLEQPVVFLLWGKYAQQVVAAAEKALTTPPQRKYTLLSAHPSPLSARRGFLGSRPFSRANACLVQDGAEPIRWDCW